MTKSFNLGETAAGVSLAAAFLRSADIGPESNRAATRLAALAQDALANDGDAKQDIAATFDSGEVTRLMQKFTPVFRFHAANEFLSNEPGQASELEATLRKNTVFMVRDPMRTGIAIDNEVRKYLKDAQAAATRDAGPFRRWTAVRNPDDIGSGSTKIFKEIMERLKASGHVTGTYLSMSRRDGGGTMGNGFDGTMRAARIVAERNASYQVVDYADGFVVRSAGGPG